MQSLPRKTIHIHANSWQIIFNTAFICCTIGSVLSLIFEYPLLRHVTVPGACFALIMLLFVWHRRYGSLSKVHTFLVAAGLVWLIPGDLCIMTRQVDSLHMVGMVCYMVSYTLLTCAAWTPGNIDTLPSSNLAICLFATWRRSVPLRLWAIPLAMLPPGIVVSIWMINNKNVSDTRIIPTIAYLTVVIIFIWRRFARLRYRSPSEFEVFKSFQQSLSRAHNSSVLSQQEQTMPFNSARGADDGLPTFKRYAQATSHESYASHLLGAIGAISLVFCHIAAGIASFWKLSTRQYDIESRSDVLLVLFMCSDAIAQILLVSAVPFVQEPIAHFADPLVTPQPFPGDPLRVLLLRGSDSPVDAVQVAVLWYILSARGHIVDFAASPGRNAFYYHSSASKNEHVAVCWKLDFSLSSGVGIGSCRVARASPLVRYMVHLLQESPAYLNPREIDADDAMFQYDGIVVTTTPLLQTKPKDSIRRQTRVVLSNASEFLEGNGTIGVMADCFTLLPEDTYKKRLVPSIAKRTFSYLSILLGCVTCSRGRCWNGVRLIFDCSKIINTTRQIDFDFTSLRRGTPLNDSDAFVVEDDGLVSARWTGDAFLWARRFYQVLERRAATTG